MVSENLNKYIRAMYKKDLTIVLEDILNDLPTKKDYDLFCEFIENYILDDYIRADESVTIVCAKNDIVNITLFQFLINLYFLEFNFMYNIPITRDWMIDVDKEFLSKYHSYVENMCRDKIYPIIKNNKKINEEKCYSFLLSHLTERMEKLSELLSAIAAPTISIIDLVEFCNRNREFNDMLDTNLDDSKTFKQLEDELKVKGKQLMNIIKNDGKSCLYPFAEANCLNENQVTQMFVAVGPRMSATNVVMPHVMKRSYLNGLQNVGDLIAESEIAAKALIYKKKFVGVSGYMSRETNLSCLNLRIDYNKQDCGTKHFINYFVRSPQHLDLIISKNIILPNGKLKKVEPTDTDLIGKVVKLRSICCCAHEKRGFVCKNCYGNPPEFKKSYKIGGATSTEVENKLSNAVMAVKHHSSTKTIEFNDEKLLKYFDLVDSQLILKRFENAENVSILFNKEYIEDIIDRVKNDEDIDDEYDEENQNEDDEGGTHVVSKMLTDLKVMIKTVDQVTGEEIEEEYEVKLDGSFLILADEMLTESNLNSINLPIDSDTAILKLSNIKYGTPIFNVKYITAETSRYLKELKNIIERSKPNWYDNDLDAPIQDFADLVIEAGLKDEELVFLEPIIYALTRKKTDITSRPDFSKDDLDFYVINLKTAILKGDLYSALVYQEVTKTMKDIDSFEKDGIGEGIHDSSFKTSIKHDFSYMKKALKKAKMI